MHYIISILEPICDIQYIHGAIGAFIGYWINRFVKEYIIKENRDRAKS